VVLDGGGANWLSIEGAKTEVLQVPKGKGWEWGNHSPRGETTCRKG